MLKSVFACQASLYIYSLISSESKSNDVVFSDLFTVKKSETSDEHRWSHTTCEMQQQLINLGILGAVTPLPFMYIYILHWCLFCDFRGKSSSFY